MKAAQRERWIELAVNATKAAEVEAEKLYLAGCYYLCSFCRYAKWYGCGDDGGIDCQHPLYDRAMDFPYFVDAPEVDCWGFRPRKGGFEKLALEVFNYRRVEVKEV